MTFIAMVWPAVSCCILLTSLIVAAENGHNAVPPIPPPAAATTTTTKPAPQMANNGHHDAPVTAAAAVTTKTVGAAAITSKAPSVTLTLKLKTNQNGNDSTHQNDSITMTTVGYIPTTTINQSEIAMKKLRESWKNHANGSFHHIHFGNASDYQVQSTNYTELKHKVCKFFWNF